MEIANPNKLSANFQGQIKPWKDTEKPKHKQLPADRVTIDKEWGSDDRMWSLIATPIKKGVDSIKSFTVKELPPEELQEYSENALLLKESTNLITMGAGTLSCIACIGAAGALGLTAISVVGMVKSDEPAKFTDHAASAGWGVQASLQVGAKAFNMGKGVSRFVAGLGVGGGILETGLGVVRLKNGIKTKDKNLAIKGLLDMGTGITWAISSAFIPPPLGSALFMGAALTKVAYMNRNKLKNLVKKTSNKIKRLFTGKKEEPEKEKKPGQQVEVKVVEHTPDGNIISVKPLKTKDPLIIVPKSENPEKPADPIILYPNDNSVKK